MYEITYLVFIKYRGPFGISIPLPRLRTAHVDRTVPAFHAFDLADLLCPEEDWESTIPPYLRRSTPVPCFND